jgi:HNH endonuclease
MTEPKLLPIAGRHGRGLRVLVDPDVYEWAIHHRWYVTDRGYIYRQRSQHERAERKTVRLHNEVLPPNPGEVIDHINRDKLDNRRVNLRSVTHSMNTMNRGLMQGRSRYRGISGTPGRWQAKLKIGGIELRLGQFVSERDAAHVYDLFASLLLGDDAQLNFPHQGRKTTLARLRLLLGLEGG